MKTRNLFYVAGCTGSNNPQAFRVMAEKEGSTTIITRPLRRGPFGTHTTSLAAIIGQTGFLIDNGTGVGQAADFLRAKQVSDIYMLQTHYHLDHMAGLPTNSLLFMKNKVTAIYAPELGGPDFRVAIDQFFTPWLWPVSPSTFGVDHEVVMFMPGGSLPVGHGLETVPLMHPGGCAGYRLASPAGDMVVITDNELSGELILDRLALFVSGARFMYIDVQYRDGEYIGQLPIGLNEEKMSRIKWGHSTPLMLLQLLKRTKVPPALVIIGHHDPKRSEEDLVAFEHEVVTLCSGLPTKISFAREGALYDLSEIQTL